LYRKDDGIEVMSWPFPSGILTDLEVSPNGKWFVGAASVSGKRGRMRVFVQKLEIDVPALELGLRDWIHPKVTVSTDGQRICVTSMSGGIAVWNTSGGAPLWERDLTPFSRRDVAIAPDGHMLILVGKDENDRTSLGRILDSKTGTDVGAFDLQSRGLSIDFLPDGEHVVVAEELHGVALRRLPDGSIVERLLGLEKTHPLTVAVAPDGARLAVSTAEGPVHILRLGTEGIEEYLETKLGGFSLRCPPPRPG